MARHILMVSLALTVPLGTTVQATPETLFQEASGIEQSQSVSQENNVTQKEIVIPENILATIADEELMVDHENTTSDTASCNANVNNNNDDYSDNDTAENEAVEEVKESVEHCSISNTNDKREVIFQDDLLDLVKLDDGCEKHIDRFKELNIIIKAVNEYHCPPGDQIEVTIQNNKWTVIIKNMTEDLLLECIPIQNLLPKGKCHGRFSHFLNGITNFTHKLKVYLWGLTLAKYAKCTVLINGNIHPNDEHVLCSDVIIDVVDWSEKEQLLIKRTTNNTGLFNLNLHSTIVISKK